MKKSISIFLCILLLITTFCGCAAKPKDNGRIKIVTTVFPLYDFARAVVGDKGEVKLLIPPGGDIHSFEPTARDVAEIQDSDLFLYIGGESDAWVDKILSAIDISVAAVVKMVDSVALIGDDHHGYDEHIWTSPDNAVRMLQQIETAISRIDAENADYYAEAAASYTNKINSVEAETRKVIAESNKKTIVVADRFPLIYFTEYYGLDYVAAFGGCEHDTDADLLTVTRLIDRVKQENLAAVFRVELSNLSVADTVSAATGAKVLELHSAQNISAGELTSGVTYVDIMQKNAEALREGLK